VKSGASPPYGSILKAWSTNDRVTTFLVEQLPAALWDAAVPGSPRRTIRRNGLWQWTKRAAEARR